MFLLRSGVPATVRRWQMNRSSGPQRRMKSSRPLPSPLRFNGRKRVQGDELMAKITAERLVEHLERSGFVVMKKPPLAPPTTLKARQEPAP